jgi:alpha-ketoglutaric semialdehyde dehydrogenase
MAPDSPQLPGVSAEARPVLIAGGWRQAAAKDFFHATDPTTNRPRTETWPVSGWSDVETALDAATAAAAELAGLPAARIADFLHRYAARLEVCGDELVALAHAESGLAKKPRLADVELPRTLDQLRQAAAAAREGSWRMISIDRPRNLRAASFGIGPVVVLPPGNFPLAYGAVTGGDFAAAIAGGNPVIAKAHPWCPAVSHRAAAEAVAALGEAGLPPATVQLLHGISPTDGERLVADPRVGGTGFTGSEAAGRRLFAAAAANGRVIWAEMGSMNPVVLLPGAIAERPDAIADDLTASVTGSAGQFCTKPGLVFLVDDAAAAGFVAALAERFRRVGPQVLLAPPARDRLLGAAAMIRAAGGRVIVGGDAEDDTAGCTHSPLLLETTASELLANPEGLLVEAFGNVTLLVRCRDAAELGAAIAVVRGSLAASLYLARDGRDATLAATVSDLLVARAGRVIENRMPTGLAVSPATQHGGPWPSAAPPFLSAVGFPWTILRFARRVCFDGWSQERLPECVRDAVPPGAAWRYVDGGWTRG